MKTLIVILICIALVGAELGAIALLVAPRTVWRWVRYLGRTGAERVVTAIGRTFADLRRLLGGGGPGLRPPRLA